MVAVKRNWNCVKDVRMVSSDNGCETYSAGHFNDLQPTVKLRHEVDRSTECNCSSAQETIVESRVFTNAFTEWTTLEQNLSMNHGKRHEKTHLEVDRKS